MCYEPNRDVIVIGYRDGFVCFFFSWLVESNSLKEFNSVFREIRLFSSTSNELIHVVAEQTKTILSITWHPETVFASSSQISPCRNWLAVAGEKVLVYDVPGICPNIFFSR